MRRVTLRWVTLPVVVVLTALGLTFVAVPPAFAAGLTVTSTTLQPATVGSAYNQSLSATGGSGNYTWSMPSGTLPPGLTFNASGSITGSPNTGGTFTFTIQATDVSNNSLTGSAPVSITVNKGAVTVAPGSNALSTGPGQFAVAQSQAVTYSAAVGGSGTSTPTGTVTFTTTPSNATLCVATLSGGNASCTSSALPTPATTYTVTAIYSGDGNFLANNATIIMNVNVATTTTATVSESPPSASTFGQSVLYSALVTPASGVVTGTVTFTATPSSGPTIALCLPIAVSSSAASCTSTLAPGGSDTITAIYSGVWTGTVGTSFNGFSGTGSYTVNPAPTTTTTSVSPSPVVFGQTVTYTVNVSSNAGTPTGSVNFFVQGPNTLLCTAPLNPNGTNNATGTCNSAGAPVGADTFIAPYAGTANFASSSAAAPLTLTVNNAATTTSIGASPPGSSYGSSVTFNATVTVNAPGSGSPAGSVTFTTGATTICTAVITAGSGSCVNGSTKVPVGADMVTGTFTGSGNFNGSTGTTTETVSQASTAVAASELPTSAPLGTAITYSAQVTSTGGTPTGTVAFALSESSGLLTLCAAAPLTSGTATCVSSAAPFGSSQGVIAFYSGDTNFQNDSGTNTVTITKGVTAATVTVNPTTLDFNQSVTYTAHVTSPGGTPTGVVSFAIGSTPLCGPAPLSAGVASCASPAAPVGNNETVTATYGGDTQFLGITGSTTLSVVNPAPTTTTVSPSAPSAAFGQLVTYTATVTPTDGGSPTGTVSFGIGALTLCAASPVTADTATCAVATSTVGTSEIVTATYSGEIDFTGSVGTTTVTINKDGTTTLIPTAPTGGPFGTTVNYSATVTSIDGGSPPPTGIVTLSIGSTLLCSPTLSGGTATCSANNAPVGGGETVTATYSGDGNYLSSSGTNMVTITNAATQTVVTVPSSAVFGQLITYSATVSPVLAPIGTPTGTVVFKADNGSGPVALCTATLSGGTFSCPAGTAPVGNDTITATYSGDANFAGSVDNSHKIAVGQASTTVALVSSANPGPSQSSITYTATVAVAAPGAGTPGGTVSFTSQGNPIAACSGGNAVTLVALTAACPITGPNPGTYNIVATYTPDLTDSTSFLGSTSNTLAEVINAAPTTTTVSPSAPSAAFGQLVTYTATVTPTDGGSPTGTVSFGIGALTLCAASPVTADTATCAVATSTVGTSEIVTATYSGEIDFTGSVGTTTVTINKDGTTTLIPTAPTGGPFGTTVNYSATVTSIDGGSPPPTGIVTLSIGSTLLCSPTLSGGTATCSANNAPVGGGETVTATYSGDGNYLSSSGTNMVTITNAATQTVVTVPSSAVFGQLITYSATVSPVLAPIGTPTGTVVFKADNGSGPVALCTATLSGGTFSCPAGTAPVGNDTITATYSGDANFAGSVDNSHKIAVGQASTTVALVSSANPGPSQSSITYTATVAVAAPGAGTPGGTVSFTSQGNPIAACSGGNAVTLVALTAACPITGPNPGTYNIVATYTPDLTDSTSFLGSTSNTLAEVINAAPTTTTVSTNPPAAVIGTSVTYSANITSGGGSPAGTVAFFIGTTHLCSAGVTATVASCSASNAPLGINDIVTATYSGNVDFTGSASTVLLSVGPTAPAAPAGASASSGATSPSPSGSGVAQIAAGQATGNGYGALTFSSFATDPESAAVSLGTGQFSSIEISPLSQFTSVVGSVCGVGTGHSVDWWNGTAWVPLAGQSLSITSGCISFTLTASSVPSLTGLTNLVVGVSMAQGPEAGAGYWLAASDGGIFGFGDVGFYGSTGAIHLNQPIVGLAASPDSHGYWLVASDGGIFAFGDSLFYGSTGSIHLNKPIVGMESSPDGHGYWLVASDGGIFSFGDAHFYGSTGAVHLNQPIVGMTATPDGKGYWLLASDGGIFAFGDATFYGSTGATQLNKPIVGMATTPDGHGYWLVASDGGIFAFGDAIFHGSTGAVHLNQPIVGIVTSDGKGYWLVASDGGIFIFGDAAFFGSTGGVHLNRPIVTMAEG